MEGGPTAGGRPGEGGGWWKMAVGPGRGGASQRPRWALKEAAAAAAAGGAERESSPRQRAKVRL
jgi:hypothetical protein